MKKLATMFWACSHCNRMNCALDVDTTKNLMTVCLGCQREVTVTVAEMKKEIETHETVTPIGE